MSEPSCKVVGEQTFGAMTYQVHECGCKTLDGKPCGYAEERESTEHDPRLVAPDRVRLAALREQRDRFKAERDYFRSVLQRISDMPIDPRPDGTYNYSRAALIDIAQRALDG